MTDQPNASTWASTLFPNQGKSDQANSSQLGQGTAEAQLAAATGGAPLDTVQPSTPASDSPPPSPTNLPASSLDPSFLASDTAKALGVEVTDEFKESIKEFHPVAAELKLTGDQVAKLSKWQDAQSTAYWEKQAQADIQAVKAMPDYEAHVAAARAALKSYGDEELSAFLDESGVGNSPHLIRLLSKMQASITQLRSVVSQNLQRPTAPGIQYPLPPRRR